MSESIEHDTHPVDVMLAISDILKNRRLARVYRRVMKQDGITVEEIATGLDSSSTTVYEDVNKLTDMELLERVTGTQPHRYHANRISITVQADEESYEITPVLIVTIAQSQNNRNLDVYLGRHGISGVATAIEYARACVEGRMTARVMARELNLSVIEAETVLQELREIILTINPETQTSLDIDELDAKVEAESDDNEPFADIE
jgi:sugar-specific transcriptional regulator TrmB